jgi:hypothetical protein
MLASEQRRTEARRGSVRDLYAALTELGERLYLEALCLCENEEEAAAWASANLVHALQQQNFLGRIARAS